ncbi:hypothetical protein BJ912DRAFT_332860 [Pholiota molesta]|nr:hypothetical protein BJ912DRAFT_332860 [Pholiota molesta]
MQKTDPSTSSPPATSLESEQSLLRGPNPSGSPSPRRVETAPDLQPEHEHNDQPRSFKRILVFCDGTWQDGIENKRSAYTNVLRLARSVRHEDTRNLKDGPPVMQVVFYQAGIGSDKNLYSEYIEGTTGSSLPDKVEDAYAFIAHNYHPGDEIYLFGFSRGAYTARMVAMFIDAIGVLSRCDMDYFATIFLNFQKLAKCKNIEDKDQLQAYLDPWLSRDSKGHKRASFNGKKKFTIKCLGVWDTVGSLGLPDELRMKDKKTHQLFGFPDPILGEHIEAAYQALAINEMRKDFVCSKFIQTPDGKAKGQILKQTWFTGCHSDIGGGYHEHDLSDLTLIWMASNISADLFIDTDYLQKLIKPVAPWGAQKTHDSKTGVFLLADTLQRTLPVALNPETHETIHSSVLEQTKLNPALATLAKNVKACPELVAELMELEKHVKATWAYDATSPRAKKYAETPKFTTSLIAQMTEGRNSFLGTISRSLSWRSLSWRSGSSSASSTDHSRRVSVASTAATEVEDVEEQTRKVTQAKGVTTISTSTVSTKFLRVGRWRRGQDA